MKRSLISLTLCSTFLSSLMPQPSLAAPPRTPDKTVECEILVVGGGLAGSAAAYEGLLAGKTVCLTEITDWVGGQISAQGTSALDERATQRELLFYPRGYLEFRERIEEYYNQLNPGECWVSESCFLPRDAHAVLLEILQEAAKRGKGTLKWYPSTVIKELELVGSNSGQNIESAIAIEHEPAPGAPPLNTFPLSETIEDWYRYEDSSRFEKKILRFVPKKGNIRPLPTTVTEGRAFLGKVGYYRRFIKNFGAIARPLTDAIKEENLADERAKTLRITPEVRTAHLKLRDALCNAPILAYPRFDEDSSFIVDTDWSHDNRAIGAVLSQLQEGKERVICYGAKKLTKGQANYSATKGELYAIIYFLRYWRYYLQWKPFTLRTDHKALTWIRTMDAPD
ncbi:MAG: FAD-dependent oxidoreductase, partial [Symploca sp. SIO1A3]|nr:FAD-dependent oxidoreductase [Symploca sp. SIO1A3]